jgi:replicative DNA helicase
MSWPWATIQAETMGVSEEDYIVFYGRPKSKKSWVLAKIIAHAYECGKNVLIYTKEMTPKNIMRRVAACLAEVPYSELRRGKLTANDKEMFYSLLRRVHEMRMSQNFTCLSAKDVPAGGDTVPWLRSKIERHGPDIVFVDGLYLMSDADTRKNKASHEKMTSISRAFRQMILDTRTPGIATMQANRKAAGHANAELDEIAFSDAIGQDATILCRVIAEKVKDPKKEPETIALVMGGCREINLDGLRIGGDCARDFNEKGLLTENEINKAKEKDVSGDEVADKKAKESMSKPRREPAPKQVQQGLLDQQLNNMS